MAILVLRLFLLLLLALVIVAKEKRKEERTRNLKFKDKQYQKTCGFLCRLKLRASDEKKDPKKNPETVHDLATQYCRRISGNSSRTKNLWYRWRRKRNSEDVTKTAYRMAVLATLSYWPFHDLSKPSNTSFRLRWDKGKRRRLRHFFSFLRNYVFGRQWRRKDKGERASSRNAPLKEKKEMGNPRYILMYWLYNWYEPTNLKIINFHDTDVLVAKSDGKRSTLTVSFAGTQSAADHVTNVQTFEPASHSSLFRGGGARTNNGTLSIEGSLHRGFLNAYSRVENGWILRLSRDDNNKTRGVKMKDPSYILHRRYEQCNVRQKKTKTKAEVENISNNEKKPEAVLKRARNGGCRAKGEKLMTILRDLITGALKQGNTVNISGHSLGGGLATLLTLDIIINFPDVPISNLYLWTFGAPQVADDVFLRSAIAVVPRLGKFLRKKHNFHRFVTFSDKCHVDLVSVVTEKALSPKSANKKRKTLRGSASRLLGGVRGNVTHFAEPHYLFTPQQAGVNDDTTKASSSTTQSVLDAHSMVNYLGGISRESRHHPLSTDLWPEMKVWLGEELYE